MIGGTLHPHARVDGRRVADLELGEHYQVAALWRSGVDAPALQRGEAAHGPLARRHGRLFLSQEG